MEENIKFMNLVSATYSRTGTLRKTAEEMGIAYAKVRKVLITLGEYETEFSKEVARKRKEGKPIADIARELHTSANRVSAFSPYERVIYDSEESTPEAIRSKTYRNRIQTAQENFVTGTVNGNDSKMGKEKRMTKDNRQGISQEDKQLSVIYLHLEMKGEFLTDNEKRLLRRYGESGTGEFISRDVLIPSDMLLHNLHYVIQRLFGWQNSHLRRFILPEDIYDQLTGGTVKGWIDLVGVLFQPPSEHKKDIFWDDDYRSGSIKTWLKKKYTGPYYYGGKLEQYEAARKDVQDLLENLSMLDVRESFQDFYERKTKDGDAVIRILRRAPLIDLTLQELHSSIIMEGGTEDILECLEVGKMLSVKGEPLTQDGVFPVTQELLYNYDFGDNWVVTITRESNCHTLINNGYVSAEEIEAAIEKVLCSHAPVCVHKEGVNVLDDVGGLRGFADFLNNIYENEDKEESAEYMRWAKSLGWSDRKVSNKLML